MPTRFYTVPTLNADIAPAFSGSWTTTTGATRRNMVINKLTDPVAALETHTVPAGTPVTSATYQLVGPPLAAQTISGTVTTVLGFGNATVATFATRPYRIIVTDSTGTVVRGTLVAFNNVAGTAMQSSPNYSGLRYANAVALSSLAVLAGDRIVVEIGVGSAATAGGTYNASLGTNGADYANADAPAGINTSWVEFSGTITFSNVTTATPTSVQDMTNTIYIEAYEPGSQYLALFRVAPGENVNQYLTEWQLGNTGAYPRNLVRPNTVVGSTGWDQMTSNGWASWTDTEMALDFPYTYVAYDITNNIQFPPSLPAQAPSEYPYWLRDPLYPATDVALHNYAPSLADCIPIDSLYFGGWSSEVYNDLGATQQIDDSPYPVLGVRTRQGATTGLTVVPRTFFGRDALKAKLARGTIQFFQARPQYGIADSYWAVGAVNYDIPLSDLRRQFRLVTMPFTAMQRPVGLAYGAFPQRWIDTRTPTFALQTWTQATAAAINTQQLMVLVP